MASPADIKNNLRKLDFPACAIEALSRIEALISSRSKQNLAMQLISEFIFLERTKEVDIRKGQSPQPYATSQMNSFQEFQLILSLIDFFSKPGSEATRNAIFLSIFSCNLTPQRTKVLCHMVSTAISGSVAPVLYSTATWMQQVGCMTPPSLEVAQSIVSDFIIFSRKLSEQIKQLPMVAPHFSANFMTAVADLYLNEHHNGTLTLPPDTLLEVFTEWINESPMLCLASQQPLILPAGAISMPVVTPLAGLIRWTVLAPLVSNRPIYSNLHLSLLKTLMQIADNEPTTALHSQDLLQLVTALQKYAARLAADKVILKEDQAYQKCMDRFAQAIQVAFKSKCIYGNTAQLVCLLETLSDHSLMKMVVSAIKRIG